MNTMLAGCGLALLIAGCSSAHAAGRCEPVDLHGRWWIFSHVSVQDAANSYGGHGVMCQMKIAASAEVRNVTCSNQEDQALMRREFLRERIPLTGDCRIRYCTEEACYRGQLNLSKDTVMGVVLGRSTASTVGTHNRGMFSLMKEVRAVSQSAPQEHEVIIEDGISLDD
jgi:hypothetical protein